MYPEMVLSTRALPVSASMYLSTHFRREEEEREGKGEEGEEEKGRRRERRRKGPCSEQPHSEQYLHAYTTVAHREAPNNMTTREAPSDMAL